MILTFFFQVFEGSIQSVASSIPKKVDCKTWNLEVLYVIL